MPQIFGPVPSRRLGFSLGVDIIPLKTCSLNCIYCQLGRTTWQTIQRKEYVPVKAIISELRPVLTSGQRIDYITFSGSGEPTLNSKIGTMIREIKDMSNIPVAVLTNGTLLYEEKVRHDLRAADLVVPSLDAVSPEAFHRVNRPHGKLDIQRIIDGLAQFRQEYSGQIWLEIMLVKGINDTSEELERLKETTHRIEPDKIQLNTVIRPPAENDATPLGLDELERVRKFFGPICEVIAEFDRRDQAVYQLNIQEAILTMIRRRPVTLEDICSSLGRHRDEIIKYLEVLKNEGEIGSRLFKGRRYFVKSEPIRQTREP